jgi:hypothetical protein
MAALRSEVCSGVCGVCRVPNEEAHLRIRQVPPKSLMVPNCKKSMVSMPVPWCLFGAEIGAIHATMLNELKRAKP